MGKKQPRSGQTNKQKQGASKPKTDQAEKKFNEIRDLLKLEFSLDGIQVLNVYSATPAQMDALAKTYSEVSDVDPEVWPVGERLDFVNGLWAFCQAKNFDFPLRIREGATQPLAPSGKENVLNLSPNLERQEEEQMEESVSMDTNDQAFLNKELREAVESGDESAEKLVFLDYQRAVLETLQQFQPQCSVDANKDLTLLKRRVAKQLATTESYRATVAVIPRERIKALFAESRTLLGAVGDLCPDCQSRIKQSILSTFRDLRSR